MRSPVTVKLLNEFIETLGNAARSQGRVYLVGGATALSYGFREQTIDVDIKLDPEPEGVFEAIALLKKNLKLNIELAAPDDFLPSLPGWEERSVFVKRVKLVDFFHYDLYSQVMAKVERGHETDLMDVSNFIRRGYVDASHLVSLFEAIKPQLIRYPAVDGEILGQRLEALRQLHKDEIAN